MLLVCFTRSKTLADLLNSMEQSLSLEANSNRSIGHQIPLHKWSPNVRYRDHKKLSPVAIFSQIHPIQSHPLSVRFILILYLHSCLCIPSDFFPLGVLAKISYSCLMFPMHARCTANLIASFYHYAISSSLLLLTFCFPLIFFQHTFPEHTQTRVLPSVSGPWNLITRRSSRKKSYNLLFCDTDF
jgi:hypothetical protein